MDVGQVNEIQALKFAYDAFVQLIRFPQYKKTTTTTAGDFFTLGSDSDHGVDERFLKAFNLGKDVVTQSADFTPEEDALLQDNVQFAFVGQACHVAASKGKDKIENHTYAGFEQMQLGAIRFQLQGQRKMALCHCCDICAFVVSNNKLKAMRSFVKERCPSSRRSCLSGRGSQRINSMKWADGSVRYTEQMLSQVI